MPIDSVGQEFGLGTRGMTCLCLVLSGVSAGKTKQLVTETVNENAYKGPLHVVWASLHHGSLQMESDFSLDGSVLQVQTLANKTVAALSLGT